MFNAENDIKKWAPVLEHVDAPAIQDNYRKAVTAKLLENTENALKQEAAQYGSLNENNQTTGAVSNFDPVLISLVRRAMPNLIAYDIAGVQPMSGPTGLIFAMKSRYNGTDASPQNPLITTGDDEALGLDEPNTAFSGTASALAGVDGEGIENRTTQAAEKLGASGGTPFGDMVSLSRKRLLKLRHVLLRLNTQWSLLKILKLSTTWMLNQNLQTSFQLKSLLKSIAKLFKLSTQLLSLVSKTNQYLLSMVLSTLLLMLTVVGQLKSSRALCSKLRSKQMLLLRKLVAVKATSLYVQVT
jgi:hypothetical protein